MSYIDDNEYGTRLYITDQDTLVLRDYIENGKFVVQLIPAAQKWCEEHGHNGFIRRVDYALRDSSDPKHERRWYYYMDFGTLKNAILFKTWFL